MCKIEISPKATESTIAKAFDRAEAQASNYTLNFHPKEGNYQVIGVRKTGTDVFYIVQTECIFDECIACDCPEYKRSHFCKHCAMVIEAVVYDELAAIEQTKRDWFGSDTDRYAF